MLEMLRDDQVMGVMGFSAAVALIDMIDAMPTEGIINPEIAAPGDAESARPGAEMVDRQFGEEHRPILLRLQVDAFAILARAGGVRMSHQSIDLQRNAFPLPEESGQVREWLES